MNKVAFYCLFGLTLLFSSCNYDGEMDTVSPAMDSENSGQGQNQDSLHGLITAAEWNDLENWNFWKNLLENETYSNNRDYWSFYNSNRVSILIESSNQPVVNAQVKLLRNGEIVWESRTDNFGKAELWIDLFEDNPSIEIMEYSLSVDGQPINQPLKLYSEGINNIELSTYSFPSNRVELSFIVDATGSMSDELSFLKHDLNNVINRVKDDNPSLQIYTSSIFYRDEGDEYIVKKSDFTDNLNNTLNFINKQEAGGGGDYPEAVHSAMKAGIEELQWSNEAKTRIAFLLLDAPPHHEPQIIDQLQYSIEEAARKGIKVIPITASGIGKETEFLMRFFSMSTNGTYVFITNHSGIGNDHIEASVGEYQVEYLNDLMVRIIKKYSK